MSSHPVAGAPESAAPKSSLPELTGDLRLTVGQRGERAIATRQFHRGALRIMRPHYLDDSGQVCYVILNPGGGYLGGDTYSIDVEVRDGARLLLTTQSATKVYRTPGSRAEQHMRLRLGPGSSLESVPDQLIAYREARYRQQTMVDMDPTASLVMAEVVTPGWSPDGRLFRYDELRLRTDIYVGGELMVLDNLLIRPADEAPVAGMTFLEDYTHVGSLVVIDPRVDAALLEEIRAAVAGLDPDGQLGLSLLNGHGFVLRALSRSTEGLNSLVLAAVDLLRARWYGQGPLNLRKY